MRPWRSTGQLANTSSHIKRCCPFTSALLNSIPARQGMLFDPFMHAGSLLAIDRNLVDLDDYEAASNNFIIVYKPGLDPTTITNFGRAGAHSSLADMSRNGRITGHPVSYVVVWNVDQWNDSLQSVQNAKSELVNDYTLIFSARHIPLQLFRLKRELDMLK